MVAAAALYIPSHLLPVMTVVELGDVTHNTIIGGMMTFWRTGAYPIAIVIFTASILIPLLKIAALSWLCAAATGKVHPSPTTLGKSIWFTELLGRWSMVDIFVVGILVSARAARQLHDASPRGRERLHSPAWSCLPCSRR